MSTTNSTDGELPELFDSEDGDRWWATGHIEPDLMVAAVTAWLRGMGEFFHPTDLLNIDRDHVQHIWAFDDGNDRDDSMRLCEPDHDGATPFTQLDAS